MKLSAMKATNRTLQVPQAPEDAPEGSFVETLSTETATEILERLARNREAYVAAKEAAKDDHRGDDDEYPSGPEEDSEQNLWDALSLLDDCRDLFNSLIGNYKVHAGSIIAPRHMVAEVERLCHTVANFVDQWDTSNAAERS